MKFDKTAPGGGIGVTCRLENGKAFLEWECHFQGEDDGCAGNRMEQGFLRLLLMDAQGDMVLECIQELWEEETLRSVLLHPQLWRSTQNPYLYTLEAHIIDQEGRCLDSICSPLPLRSVEMRGTSGLFFNGKPFCPKAVSYTMPEAGSGAERQRRIFEDLQKLRKLGADCIYTEEKEGLTKLFLQLCDRLGFFVLSKDKKEEEDMRIYGCGCRLKAEYLADMPCFQGGSSSLFAPDRKSPASLFYKYKARWSKEPFVYIVPESVKRLKSGNYTAVCYSSCSRIALYSDGILFELKKGEAEFEFLEIPAKSPCIVLAAEGDECSAALSIHKTFLKRF